MTCLELAKQEAEKFHAQGIECRIAYGRRNRRDKNLHAWVIVNGWLDDPTFKVMVPLDNVDPLEYEEEPRWQLEMFL